MKQDKFLIGILVGIGLLVIVAITAVMLRSPGSEEYQNENTPQAVVHDYYLAIQRKDYEKAHGYLADDLVSKPTLEQFVAAVGTSYNTAESSLKIGEVRPGDETTQVDVIITTYNVGGVFDSSRYSTPDIALLRANAAGEWKLVQFPYPYWGWDWNQDEDK